MYLSLCFVTVKLFLNLFFEVVEGMKYCAVVAVGSSSKCPKSPENVDATLNECPVEEMEVYVCVLELLHMYLFLMVYY